MADFIIQFSDSETGNRSGEFKPQNLGWSIRNSEPGDITCEIALGDPALTLEQFGPYRTDYALYRTGAGGNKRLIVEGMVTSVNLNGDRDTILVAGKDWIHYLERRVYPFDPVLYRAGDWEQWPVGWPHFPNSRREKQGNPVEVRDIVEDMLDHMQSVTLPSLPGGVPAGPGMGQLDIIFNNVPTGQETKYKIYPGDQTTMFEHIQKLSEQVNGFEFDILPGSREFKMWSPGRLKSDVIYRIITQQGDESKGAVVNLDWTNDGPDGTYLVGLGTAGKRAGAVWYYRPSIESFRWLDQLYDFGEMANTDLLFNMLKDQNDLYPQRKLSLTLVNPEFLSPSLYTGGRPRALIGQRVNVQHFFRPYWHVNSDYKVNAINWTTDESSNETVEFELEIIYEEGTISTLPHGI